MEAVFKRLIPASIFEEVRAYVIGARVVKREWALNMNLQYDPSLKLNEPDHFISRTTVSYKLFDIMPYAEVQVIRSSLNLDLSGADATGALPRYDKVSLDNEKFEGETLTHLLGEDRCSYQIMRSIEGNQRKFVHVVNEISEIVRIPDTFVWSMNAPTEDATINITSSDPNVGFQVRALHPDSARLTEVVGGRQWTFRGGMLPWQGFEIRSFYRTTSHLTKPEEEQLQLHVIANAQQTAKAPPSGESGL